MLLTSTLEIPYGIGDLSDYRNVDCCKASDYHWGHTLIFLRRSRNTTCPVGVLTPESSASGQVQIAGDPDPAFTAHARIVAYNGHRRGGHQTILLHSRVPSLALTLVLTGVLRNAPKPFGKVLDVSVPVLPGGAALSRFQGEEELPGQGEAPPLRLRPLLAWDVALQGDLCLRLTALDAERHADLPRHGRRRVRRRQRRRPPGDEGSDPRRSAQVSPRASMHSKRIQGQVHNSRR